MMFLENMEQMNREHGAWLDVCQELRARGVDVNEEEHEAVAHAVEKWGEELVALRSAQSADLRQQVLDEKRERYPGRYERGTYPDA